ncbi:MAG: hypothetical protein KAR39_01590 [Thermoplasmata archaeon]|nr:hypothetical protein [Thermoplasmata archaeon]
MGPRVYYSDRDSERMIEERNLNVKAAYFVTIGILIAYSLPFIVLVIGWRASSLETNTVVVVLWILGALLIFGILHRLHIVATRNELKLGITLTDEALEFYSFRIPISAILRVEIVEFKFYDTFLAIGYALRNTQREKARTLFIKKSHTEDFSDLCDRIRELKGVPKQTLIHTERLKDWKASLKQLARSEVL